MQRSNIVWLDKVWSAFVSHQPHASSRFLLPGRSNAAVTAWIHRNGGELLQGPVLADTLDALSHTDAGPFGPDAAATLVAPLRRVARASVLFLLDSLAAVRGPAHGSSLVASEPPRSARTVSRHESATEAPGSPTEGVEAWQEVVKLRLQVEEKAHQVEGLEAKLGDYMDQAQFDAERRFQARMNSAKKLIFKRGFNGRDVGIFRILSDQVPSTLVAWLTEYGTWLGPYG